MLFISDPQWLESFAAAFGSSPREVLTNAIRVVSLWLLAWLALVLVRRIAHRIEMRVDDGDPYVTTLEEKRGRTIAQLVREAGRVVVLASAIVLTLRIFIDITPLLGATAVLGLGISFGAQSLVKDLISGFFMLAENQFGVGDIIRAADVSGVVEEFTLRVVKIRSLDGTLNIIPNGEIKTVSNLTRGWSRAVLEIGVAYSADVDRALAIFRDEAQKLSDDAAWVAKLDGPLEVPGIEKLGDDSVIIRTLARTVPGSQWDVAREFRRRIKNRLDAEGIDIPFPQRTVHFRLEPDDAAEGNKPISAALRKVGAG